MPRLILFLVLILTPSLCSAQGLLDGLRPSHPRLILTGADSWTDLRQRADSDEELARVIAYFQERARSIQNREPLARAKIGKRLLGVSREALERIMLLSFAYRTSSEPWFLQRAATEMETVAAFEDWNPSHFLDVAEMTAGLAIGYDWLYDDLEPKLRSRVRQAIVDKGLKPGLKVRGSWYKRDNNWNQVCIGGLCMGALAIADLEPELAAEFLQRASENWVHGLRAYEPDGIYPEGPNYWSYGTMYSVMMIACLQSALGTDWGIPDRAGFMPSAGVYVQTCSPTGGMYNFSDGSPDARFRPSLFWFARERRQPGLLYQQQRMLGESLSVLHSRIAPLAALWWPETGLGHEPELALRWTGKGINPLAIFRESWTDQGAMYLGLKGGTASANHAHMDAGSFILESDGVRWGIDLKQQSYNTLESQGVMLWGRSQDAQRWTIFRYSSFAHSTLTIDGQQQRVAGHAPITRFSADEARAFAIVDLSSIFEGQAQRVLRGFQWRAEREVLIQDELEGLQAGSVVRWAMVTRAKVELQGSRAVLHQDGQQLHASVAGQLEFEVIAADPPPGDKFSAKNPDTRILLVHAVADDHGRVQLAIRLKAGAAPSDDLDWVPVGSW